jgi:hypothetical protein
LHGEFSIATNRDAQNQQPSELIAHDFGMPLAVRLFFQPYVLAVVALAIAVGGCGYGYKLSQYFQHSEVSKASPTRMWVDHRDESLAAPAQQLIKPQQIGGFALFALAALQLPRLSRDHAVTTPAPARVTLIISSHIPFRAPPSLNPSLA